jgi:hypothetical protein
MNKVLLNTIRFVVLVLVQVFIVNHIRLGGYVHPYIYVLYVLLLPMDISKVQLLLAGFGIGFVIDLFVGTLGLHAGATTLMAFCRPAIIKLVSGGMKFENAQDPNLNQMGGAWFIRYTLCMVLVHNLALFMLESFSFKLFGQSLLRVLLSVPVSTFLIIIVLYFFTPSQKKDF